MFSRASGLVAVTLGGLGSAQPDCPVDIVAPGPLTTNFDFGTSVDIDRGWLAVGDPRDRTASTVSGSVSMHRRINGVWVETQRLLPPNPIRPDEFGATVALDDGWLFVSAPRFDTSANDAGAVFAYKLEGDTWVLRQTITDPMPQSNSIGNRLALDPPYAAIAETLFGFSPRAAVVVYELANGQWHRVQALDPGPALPASENLGEDLALVGNTLIVSTATNGNLGLPPQGGAYVFDRQPNGQWPLSQSIFSPDPMEGESFARRLAFDNDRLLLESLAAEPRLFVYERRDNVFVSTSVIDSLETAFDFVNTVLVGDRAFVRTAREVPPFFDYETLLTEYRVSGGEPLLVEQLATQALDDRFSRVLAADERFVALGGADRVGVLEARTDFPNYEISPIGSRITASISLGTDTYVIPAQLLGSLQLAAGSDCAEPRSISLVGAVLDVVDPKTGLPEIATTLADGSRVIGRNICFVLDRSLPIAGSPAAAVQDDAATISGAFSVAGEVEIEANGLLGLTLALAFGGSAAGAMLPLEDAVTPPIDLRLSLIGSNTPAISTDPLAGFDIEIDQTFEVLGPIIGSFGAITGSTEGLFSAIRVDPCIADIDGDGMASVADLVLYVQQVDASDLDADLNEDAVLDIFDVLTYQSAAVPGCGG